VKKYLKWIEHQSKLELSKS